MKARLLKISIWFAVVGGALFACDLVAAENKSRTEFTCDLKEGSRIKGFPSIQAISVQTDYARLKLPVEQIRTATFSGNHEGVKFEMSNGDRISGALDLPPFKLKTALGEMEISVEQVTRISVAQIPEAGSDFNVSRDFSTNANPNGSWSYGWAMELDGSFEILSNKLPPSNFNIFGWKGVGEAPSAFIQSGSDGMHPFGTTTIEPGQVALHPGPDGEYSIIRWTAPQAGSYRITGNFTGLSGYNGAPPTTTDVHVLRNGKPLFESFLNLHSKGNEAAFDVTPQLEAGDTVDFVVGFGNGSYGWDSTGLNVTLTPVAKPRAKNNTPVRRAK